MAGVVQGNGVKVPKSRKDILVQGLSEYLTESALHGVKYKVVFCPRSLLLGFVKTCVIQKRRQVNCFCSLLVNGLPLFVLYKHRGDQIVSTEMKTKMPKCKFSNKVY